MQRPAQPVLPMRQHWIDSGGIDLIAILMAMPVMWIALGEASSLSQTVFVASAVAGLSLTRSPAMPRGRSRRRALHADAISRSEAHR